jgi:hypothetical protein
LVRVYVGYPLAGRDMVSESSLTDDVPILTNPAAFRII